MISPISPIPSIVLSPILVYHMEGVMFHYAGDSYFSCIYSYIATNGHKLLHMPVEPFRRQVVGVFLVVPSCDAALSGIGHLAADTSQQVPDFLEERRSVQSGDSWAGASGRCGRCGRLWPFLTFVGERSAHSSIGNRVRGGSRVKSLI